MHGANLKAGTGKPGTSADPGDELPVDSTSGDSGAPDASDTLAEDRPRGIDALLSTLPDSGADGGGIPNRRRQTTAAPPPPRPTTPMVAVPMPEMVVPEVSAPVDLAGPAPFEENAAPAEPSSDADVIPFDRSKIAVVGDPHAIGAESRLDVEADQVVEPDPISSVDEMVESETSDAAVRAPERSASIEPLEGLEDVERSARSAALVRSLRAAVTPAEDLPDGIIVDRRTPKANRLDVASIATPLLIADALTQAVDAVELAVAVVERASGTMLWSSDGWTARFGEKDYLARHLPSSTELGELPIPAAGESWRRTRTVTLADGSEDLVELIMTGASSENGVHYATVVALEAIDTRTVITDRSEVIGIVDGAIAEADEGSVGVLYVDLDRFKVVHDLVGNIEARRLLELVNRRISATVRGSDLVFRMPSDEFIVVACEVEDTEGIEALAERIRVGVATLADVGNDMALTASVGIAIADGSQTGDELVAAAETAVYLAKGRGRNRIAIHDEELRSRTQRLLVVERQLRRAIDRRDVRFAYQPVVEVGTGRVVGAEALLRLGGDVGLSAVEVVAAAEQSGLMGVLGALVLEGVEEQLGHVLRSPNRDQLVMINLSAAQLADESLLTALSELIDDDSIPAGRLAVEVPESVLREHGDAVRLLAASVHKRFEIGVDGFGTSPDSFDLVADVPVNYLKLHRSITAAIGNDDGERVKLEAIIEKARAESLGVVALGVERTDQVRVLRAVGCRMAQGFLYAGAVSAEELIQLMVSGFPETAEASR